MNAMTGACMHNQKEKNINMNIEQINNGYLVCFDIHKPMENFRHERHFCKSGLEVSSYVNEVLAKFEGEDDASR